MIWSLAVVPSVISFAWARILWWVIGSLVPACGRLVAWIAMTLYSLTVSMDCRSTMMGGKQRTM
jgi:hypothetical protein